MTYRSTFILTNIHSLIKLISGLLLNKVFAIFLGTSGYALVGQFQNFITIVSGISTGSIQTGIVKYSAEYSKDVKTFKILKASSICIISGMSCLCSLIIFFNSKYFCEYIFNDYEYLFEIKLLSISLLFYGLNLYVISLLNGLGKIKLYVLVNIFLSFLNLLIVSFFIYFKQLSGALIGLILVQPLVFFVSLIILRNNLSLLLPGNFVNFNKKISLKLLKFSFGTLSSGIMTASTMIIIRNLVRDKISLSEAGIWDGGFRIVIYYNLLLALPFSINYIPKFSMSRYKSDIIKMFKESLLFNSVIIFLALIFLFILDDFIIKLLFSGEFSSMNEFLFILLVAESIRIYGVYIANFYTAKAMIFRNFIYESLFYLTFIITSYQLVDTYKVLGVCYAYLFSSACYLITYLISFKFLGNDIS